MIRIRLMFDVILILAFAGCATTANPTVSIQTGAILAEEHFEDIETAAWPSYSLGGIVFGVVDGQYAAIASGSGYIWELNRQNHQNVSIDARVQQLSPAPENIYGLICRAHASLNGMGYYFLLDGHGQFGIRKGDGERLSVLVPWTPSDAIKTGEVNRLRAVCVDDYLAFYVNDTFLAEARDSHFSEGWAGFAINAGGDFQIAVTFDDVIIHEVQISPSE